MHHYANEEKKPRDTATNANLSKHEPEESWGLISKALANVKVFANQSLDWVSDRLLHMADDLPPALFAKSIGELDFSDKRMWEGLYNDAIEEFKNDWLLKRISLTGLLQILPSWQTYVVDKKLSPSSYENGINNLVVFLKKHAEDKSQPEEKEIHAIHDKIEQDLQAFRQKLLADPELMQELFISDVIQWLLDLSQASLSVEEFIKELEYYNSLATPIQFENMLHGVVAIMRNYPETPTYIQSLSLLLSSQLETLRHNNAQTVSQVKSSQLDIPDSQESITLKQPTTTIIKETTPVSKPVSNDVHENSLEHGSKVHDDHVQSKSYGILKALYNPLQEAVKYAINHKAETLLAALAYQATAVAALDSAVSPSTARSNALTSNDVLEALGNSGGKLPEEIAVGLAQKAVSSDRERKAAELKREITKAFNSNRAKRNATATVSPAPVVGSEFQINEFTSGFKGISSYYSNLRRWVVSNSNGTVVPVWQSSGQVGAYDAIISRALNSYDAGITNEVVMSNSGAGLGNQDTPTIAGALDGSSNVMTWLGFTPSDPQTGRSILARTADFSLNPLSPVTIVYNSSVDILGYPTATISKDKIANIYWDDSNTSGQNLVYKQRMDMSGNLIGNLTPINNATQGYGSYPVSATLSTGNDVTIWKNVLIVGNTTTISIRGQQTDTTNNLVGSNFEFDINSGGYVPDLACNSNDNCVIVAGDSNYNIYIQSMSLRNGIFTPGSKTIANSNPGLPEYVNSVAFNGPLGLTIWSTPQNAVVGLEGQLWQLNSDLSFHFIGTNFPVNVDNTINNFSPSITPINVAPANGTTPVPAFFVAHVGRAINADSILGRVIVPALTIVNGNQAMLYDAGQSNAINVAFDAIYNPQNVNFNFTLSPLSAGTLSVSPTVFNVTSRYNSLTGMLSGSGSLSALNAAFAPGGPGLIFNYSSNVDVSIGVSVDDGFSSATSVITGQPRPTQPPINGTSGSGGTNKTTIIAAAVGATAGLAAISGLAAGGFFCLRKRQLDERLAKKRQTDNYFAAGLYELLKLSSDYADFTSTDGAGYVSTIVELMNAIDRKQGVKLSQMMIEGTDREHYINAAANAIQSKNYITKDKHLELGLMQQGMDELAQITVNDPLVQGSAASQLQISV